MKVISEQGLAGLVDGRRRWTSLPDPRRVRLGVRVEGTKKTFGPPSLVLLRGLRIPRQGPVSMFTSSV